MQAVQGLTEGKSEELYNRRRQLGVSSDSWESAATAACQQRQLGVSSDSCVSAATAGSQQRQLGVNSDSWESAATAGSQQRQLGVSSDSCESAAIAASQQHKSNPHSAAYSTKMTGSIKAQVELAQKNRTIRKLRQNKDTPPSAHLPGYVRKTRPCPNRTEQPSPCPLPYATEVML
jgi:hypothetical protein